MVTCSHGRAHEYLTAVLRGCPMWGRPTAAPDGQRDVAEPAASSGPCDDCVPVGLDTPRYAARGTFYVRTGSDEPFCREYRDGAKSAVQDQPISNGRVKASLCHISKPMYLWPQYRRYVSMSQMGWDSCTCSRRAVISVSSCLTL